MGPVEGLPDSLIVGTQFARPWLTILIRILPGVIVMINLWIPLLAVPRRAVLTVVVNLLESTLLPPLTPALRVLPPMTLDTALRILPTTVVGAEVLVASFMATFGDRNVVGSVVVALTYRAG